MACTTKEVGQACCKHFYFYCVRGDETLVHQWNLKHKHETMQWKNMGSPTPHIHQVQKFSGNIMAIVHWDRKDLPLLWITQHMSTTAGESNAANILCMMPSKTNAEENLQEEFFSSYFPSPSHGNFILLHSGAQPPILHSRLSPSDCCMFKIQKNFL